MKRFIVNNKFFVILLSMALIVTGFLSVYVVQKNISEQKPSVPEQNDVPEDPDKPAEITALSAGYTRSSASANAMSGNVITVSWAYNENSQKVSNVYLYLNDGEPISVSTYSFYELPQSVYDFPTGENKIRLELHLANGKTVEEERVIEVKPIISVKQDVVMEGSTLKVTLEYMYDAQRAVEVPEILITSNSSSYMPSVAYINTAYQQEGTRVMARSTYNFSWNTPEDISEKMSVRWKFNDITDSFDMVIKKPVKEEPKE